MRGPHAITMLLVPDPDRRLHLRQFLQCGRALIKKRRRINNMQLIDALVTVLQNLGVRHIFGVSGANIEHLHDAVCRLGRNRTAARVKKSGIENILCKSEVGAAFMADGQARLWGGLGVCCATSGGGMMNLATGIAESRASNVPVLALVGLPARSGWNQGAFQDSSGGEYGVDAGALWRSLCKYSVVLEPERFWDQLHFAITQAISNSPGPCALLLPRDVMTMDVDACPADWPETLDGFRHNTSLMPVEVDEILRALAGARRPLLIAGESIDQSIALDVFAHETNIAVVTTLAATAAISHAHPAYAGVIGIAGHPAAHERVAGADLVIVIGCQLEAMVRTPLEPVLAEKRILLIHHRVDAVPASLPARVFQVDPALAIQQLVAGISAPVGAVASLSISDRWTQANATNKSMLLPATPIAPTPCRSDTGPLALSRALAQVQRRLGAFDQLFFDAGNCAATAAHRLRIPAGARSRIALGMGGMGYAICAAIGARMDRGPGRSLVVCGDGAFLMTGLEIHTAIEHQLPILWLVCNDSQHGMCTSRQRMFFDGRLTCSRYAEVDIWQVAAGLSVANQLWVGCARNEVELEQQLGAYLQQNRPGVLELKISVEEVPPFYPLLPLAEKYATEALID